MKALYTKLIAGLCGASLFVVFAVVLISSLSRYLFNAPIPWGEDVSRYAMIYGTMFGTVLCYLSDLHIKFGIVDNLATPTIKRIISLLVDLMVLGTGVVLTWSGYIFVVKRGSILSPTLQIPMGYLQAAMIVGGVGLTIAALLTLPEHLRKTTVKGEDA